MGKGRKDKDQGQPKTVQVDGERKSRIISDGSGDGNGGNGGGSPDAGLSVALVRIDASVHGRCSVDQPVRVVVTNAGLEVHATAGRLGDIPPAYRARVSDRGYNSGRITALDTNPLKARVHLN
ncbi:MAG TPA: hypothetical protein VF092_18425 [Longimicrobium sp.]